MKFSMNEKVLVPFIVQRLPTEGKVRLTNLVPLSIDSFSKNSSGNDSVYMLVDTKFIERKIENDYSDFLERVRPGQIWHNTAGKKCIILEANDDGAIYFHAGAKRKYRCGKEKFYNYWTRQGYTSECIEFKD